MLLKGCPHPATGGIGFSLCSDYRIKSQGSSACSIPFSSTRVTNTTVVRILRSHHMDGA